MIGGHIVIDATALRKQLGAFRTSSDLRAVRECIVTLGPLLLCWTLTFAIGRASPCLALLMTPITSAFLVRTFLIQHDCGHHAFFTRRWMNDAVGRVIGLLTFTPYEYWRRGHALHHAYSGNLSRRGFWDVPMLTVAQYSALNPIARFAYRLIRHPFVLFGLAPFYLFVVQQRLPFGLMRQGWKPWASTIGTSAGLVLIVWALSAQVGYVTLAIVGLPVLALTASTGVWLFFVQHYFDQAYFEAGPDWSFEEAALHGSSVYLLPPILMWFTANIGIHHIHHLDSRIPFYRLPDALDAHPELKAIGQLRIRDSAYCMGRTLWDEEQHRFVRSGRSSGRHGAAPSRPAA